MPAKALSAALVGVEGLVVEVEVDTMGPGLPAFHIVGLAEGAVRESRERVRTAIRNCGYAFPQRRITVNLAPAGLPKAGTAYDLPIALGILAASEVLPSQALAGFLLCGELSLDGMVRPIPGLLSMALAAREAGLARMLAPRSNAGEAAVVRGLEVPGVETVHQAVDLLRGALPRLIPCAWIIEALVSRSRS